MKTGQHGYVLVETLAAFAILSLSLIALFAAAGGGIQGDIHADFQRRAARLAQSMLEDAGIASPLATGTATGEAEGGLTWTLAISPYADARSPAFWLELTVRGSTQSGRSPQSFTLTTLKHQPQGATP